MNLKNKYERRRTALIYIIFKNIGRGKGLLLISVIKINMKGGQPLR